SDLVASGLVALDCFYRDPPRRPGPQGSGLLGSTLLGYDAEGHWISDQIAAHLHAKTANSKQAVAAQPVAAGPTAFVFGDLRRNLDELFPEPFRDALKHSLPKSDAVLDLQALASAEVILIGDP